jgi:hypothetical protein
MAKVRIEWACMGPLGGGEAMNQPLELLGAAETLSVGAAATSVSAPALTAQESGVEPTGFARVTGLSGAVNVAWGAGVTSSETAGWRIEAGRYALLPVKSGDAVSLVEALDPPSAVGSAAMRAVANSCAGVIAAVGVAQDLMAANSDRNGWLLQNQSAANLFIRSKGAAGTTLATTDGASLLIPPGGYYEPSKVTPHALSIIGLAFGQVFFAEEW